MKQIIGLIMLLMVGAYSCDKLPKNDELDGMWHLQQMTTFSATSEEDDASEDIAEKGIYWNINLDLLQIYSKNQVMYHDDKSGKDVYHAYCRFEYTGTTLNVCKVYLSFDVRDSLLTDSETSILEPYGIMGCADKFNIEQLGSKRMILVSDDKRLVFRRF